MKSEQIKKKIEKKRKEEEKLRRQEVTIQEAKTKIAQDLRNLQAEYFTALAVENHLSDEEVERRLKEPLKDQGGQNHV